MVTVYGFRKYDINTDRYIVSKRKATREVIKSLGDGFSVIEGTAEDVDESALDPSVPGMTKLPLPWNGS